MNNHKDIHDICHNVLKKFDDSIIDFYNEADIKNGYIIAKNRRGLEEQFQLISLSIACISAGDKTYKDVFGISEKASKIKKECKQSSGSIYIIM